MEPTEQRIDVFVSSTSKDLGVFRTAVRNVLIDRKMLPIMMEDFPAISRDATELCKAKVNEASLFIGIYAYRYGYCPNNGSIGISEMEYEWATTMGIDRLLFVIDPSVTWPDDNPIRKYADDDPRLAAFQDRVGKLLVWKTFTSPEDLALKVDRALDAWEKGPTNITKRGRIPRPALLGIVALVLATMGVIATILQHFVSGGQPIIAVLGATLGLAVCAAPLWLSSLQPIRQSIRRVWIPILSVQALLFLLVVIGRGPLVSTLGQQQLASALSAPDASTAAQQVDAAADMGVNPADPIEQALTAAVKSPADDANDARAVHLATLYAHAIPDGSPARTKLAEQISQQARSAAQQAQESLTLRLANVLTVLNPDEAVKLANDFNDTGVDAQYQSPPNLPQAQTYFDVVRYLDNTIPEKRSNQVKSVARYNLGSLSEDLNKVDDAIKYYRESLSLDASNLITRYVLSSLLLIRADQDPKGLDEAVELANKGVKNYIDPAFCSGKQDLTDDAVFDKTWHCFILETTEAGARLARKNAAANDTMKHVESLALRATMLAEANDQFRSHPGYYTAEAYYYLARATEPKTDKDTLCQIIINHNSNIDRHRVWVAYANEQLAQQGITSCQ